MKKPKIKFSHDYLKMPEYLPIWNRTILCLVHKVHYKDLPSEFIDYDTAYPKDGILENYKLPKTELLILVLLTPSEGQLWTTIRRWTPEKEKYYRSLIGEDIDIEVEYERE